MKYIMRESVIKMNYIFTDENKTWQFDFSNAIWATNQLHEVFQCVKDGILYDVDFVVEDEYNLYFIECKNSNFAGVTMPNEHKPLSPEILRTVARKYFDSLNYIRAIGRCDNKRKVYIYVLEAKNGDEHLRKFVKNRLQCRLPFKLQQHPNVKEIMITELQVVNLNEWNEKYQKFPAVRLK